MPRCSGGMACTRHANLEPACTQHHHTGGSNLFGERAQDPDQFPPFLFAFRQPFCLPLRLHQPDAILHTPGRR